MKRGYIVTVSLLGLLLGTNGSRAAMFTGIDVSDKHQRGTGGFSCTYSGSAGGIDSDCTTVTETCLAWNVCSLVNDTLKQNDSSYEWFHDLVLKDSYPSLVYCDAEVPLSERVSPASEPSTLLLLGVALAGMALFGKRRNLRQGSRH